MEAAVASNNLGSTIASSSTCFELAPVTDWPSSPAAAAAASVPLHNCCPCRRLSIHAYARAPTTGVWYYHVDVALLTAQDDAEVQFYSVPRRYNEFLALYTSVRATVDSNSSSSSSVTTNTDPMPSFPAKELVSPSFLGLLWRSTTSMVVLEERRQQFEALLQWIERHPVARTSPAYLEFLGQPPDTQDGYVSLKEYSSPHWLSALHQQLAKDKELRRRRRSSATSTVSTTSSDSTASRTGSVRVLQMETPTTAPEHQRQTASRNKNLAVLRAQKRRKASRRTKKPSLGTSSGRATIVCVV